MRHLAVAAVILVAPCFAPADDTVKMTDEGKKSVAKALAWLATQQNPDGSWTDGKYAHNTAITSFALLAFMSQGHLPNQGQYAAEVAKGMRFLLSCQREEDGYLVGARGGNMYCHGMATLTLAELWGSTADDSIKPVLKKAVDLIVKCQNDEGGWRYEPRISGADISVTIMQVMALRAAKNAGFYVPAGKAKDGKAGRDVLGDAIKYVKSCYRPESGGFTYQSYGGSTGFARTAAGCCVLLLSSKGEERDQVLKDMSRAVEYLKNNFDSAQHFFYGHYYAAHAMHQVGGKEWAEWYDNISKHLLPRQELDGYWSQIDRGGVGPIYQTSIAVIILSVPTHYLSIFQR
jgi:squalene cyclase